MWTILPSRPAEHDRISARLLHPHGPGCAAIAGELASCVYHGLARRYQDAVRELETLTGKTCPRLYLVGGGSKDDYLNRLTARATGKEV